MDVRKSVLIMIILLCAWNCVVNAALEKGQEFISFGANLSPAQRDQMFNHFRPVGRAQLLEVTNAEEYHYLSRYVPENQIGSRAISSVYLQTLAPGAGIQVQIENITWVTSGMYANAAVTAGIKDVLIKAASPFPVSGTAALTGMFKAFEVAQGQPMETIRKDIAYQELIIQGELGEDVGPNHAENLVRDIKREVIERHTTDPQEIRVIIQEQAKEYNIHLTEGQIQRIQQFMERFNQLNLSVGEIHQQLQSLQTQVKGIQEQGKQAKGLLAQIAALLQRIFAFIGKLFS